jgi:hypothetical protein
MRITSKSLRSAIREHLLSEEEKAGVEKAETKGTLNIKKIADTLGVDVAKLSAAIKAAKSGKRSNVHNAILSDVFVKLMNAQSKDTVTVMNVLKAVAAEEPEKDS